MHTISIPPQKFLNQQLNRLYIADLLVIYIPIRLAIPELRRLPHPKIST
jgi:hypothetical protein